MNEQSRKNAEALGVLEQIKQTMEEMAELTVALNKYRRYCMNTPQAANQKQGKRAKLLGAVTEEIADVLVMIEHMVYLLGIDQSAIDKIMADKITRTAERISASGSNNVPDEASGKNSCNNFWSDMVKVLRVFPYNRDEPLTESDYAYLNHKCINMCINRALRDGDGNVTHKYCQLYTDGGGEYFLPNWHFLINMK